MEASQRETALGLLYPPDAGAALPDASLAAVEARLWELCALQARRYTMGESSSLPVETAGALFESLCFTLGLRLSTLGADPALLETADLPALLREGQTELSALCEEGKRLRRLARETAPSFENTAYGDTLAAIGGFFRRYDLRFFAHEIPCMIDYPLCHPLSEALRGVLYINAYLQRLVLENRYCRRFDDSVLAELYAAAVPDPKDFLFNLFEPVAVNSLGRALLGLSPRPLGLSRQERDELLALFRGQERAQLAAALLEAADRLAAGDAPLAQYLRQTAGELLVRLAPLLDNGHLEAVFLTPRPSRP